MSDSQVNDLVRKQASKAVKFAVRKVNGIRWHFNFDGTQYIITRADGGFVSALGCTEIYFSTRLIGTAKKWLKEYLDN